MKQHDKLEPPIEYIVAGNFGEYQNYVNRKIDEMDSPSAPKVLYRYVSDVNILRGLSEIRGLYIGSYAQRRDIEEIKQAIAVIKAKSNTDPWTHKWTPDTVTSGGVITNSSIGSSFVPTNDLLSTMIKAVQELKKITDQHHLDLEKLKNENL